MKFLANSSAPARLQRAERVAASAARAARPLWLVGADLCVYARLDLHAVPARHRARAIAGRVRQLAPFAEPGWHASDREGEVLLWCWNAAKVNAALAAEDGARRRWEVLPEQVFFAPAEGGCVRDLDGQELLEHWHDGQLAFSALLPADPRERALRLRAAGMAVDREPPRAGTAPSAKRWDKPPFHWKSLLRDPIALGAAALALAVLWLAWSLAELAGTRVANARLAETLAAEEKRLAPVLAERERALALIARANTLEQQLAGADALDAAAEFEQAAGARYQRLLQWEFNGRGLRVVLEDANPDNRAYVEALTRSPWFPRAGVTPGMRPEQISLEIGFSAAREAAPLYPRAAAGGSP